MRKPMTLPPMAHHQSGVALLVVLLFLILITIAGIIAVRQSQVDLNVATSDQAGIVMLNSSDSVLAHIEQVAATPGSNIFAQNKGVFGHFVVNPEKTLGDQVSFCYRPNADDLFDMTNAYIRYMSGGTTVRNGRGVCAPGDANNYTSSRQNAMTQVVIEGVEGDLADNFDRAQKGTSSGGSAENLSPQVEINSISLLPAMSQSTDETIRACLNRPVGDATEYGVADGNINDCLRRNGIPANVVVEEGLLQLQDRGGVQTDTGAIVDVCATGVNCAIGPSSTGTSPTPPNTP